MEAARTQSSSIKDHADSQKRSHLKRSNNKWQQLDECYKFPIGCEIPVDDYIPKEYTPESSKCTYKEYDYKPNTYINGREAEYFGSVDYTLTSKNYLPFWSKEDNVKTVDEMETEVIKEEDEVEEEEEQHDEEEKADETVNDEPEREDSATPSDVTAAVLVTKDEPEEGPNTHEKQETPPHSPSPSPSPSPVAQKSPSPEITEEMQQPKEATPPPPESPVQEVPEERGHLVSPIPAAVVTAVPVETSNKPQNVITTKLAPEIIATIEAYNKIHSLP